MKIHFDLGKVHSISTDDIEVPKKSRKQPVLDLNAPMTKVILVNSQPIYIDPKMVGYVEDDELRFEK